MIRNLFIVVLLVAVAWTSYLAYNAHQLPGNHQQHSIPVPLTDEARNATNVLGQLMHIASTAAAQPSRTAGYTRMAPPATYRGAIHYSPVENLEALDSATILNSRCDHLDVAMYSFTDWEIARSIVTYANRGHRVRVYRDKGQYSQEESRNNFVAQQFAGNQNISVRVKGSRTLMHIKGYSDGCVVR